MPIDFWLVSSGVQLTREIGRLRSTAARLKLKGIDGDSNTQWSMRFNSIQREKTYPVLLFFRKEAFFGFGEEQVLHGCRQLVS